MLIAMVMVWAGVLGAGVSGRSIDNPRNASFRIKGIERGSDSLTIYLDSGDFFKDSFYLLENNATGNKNKNASVFWGDLKLKVAGEIVKGNIVKVTSNGKTIPVSYDEGDNSEWDLSEDGDNLFVSENLDFYVGDILEMENIRTEMSSNDEVALVWTPKQQLLFRKKA